MAIACFGLSGALWLALVFLAVAGAADDDRGASSAAVIWNETIPDALRGRLAGVEMISWASGPTLGNAEAGLVAALTSVRASVVSGRHRLRRRHGRARRRAAALLGLRQPGARGRCRPSVPNVTDVRA